MSEDALGAALLLESAHRGVEGAGETEKIGAVFSPKRAAIVAECQITNVVLVEWAAPERRPFFPRLAEAVSSARKRSCAPWTTGRAIERARAATGGTGRWFSVTVDGRSWAGIVTLEDADGHDTELGIWIHPDHWGNRVATRAATLALDEHVRTSPDRSVIAHVDPANAGSRKLLATLGFHHTGDTISRYGTPVQRYSRPAGACSAGSQHGADPG